MIRNCLKWLFIFLPFTVFSQQKLVPAESPVHPLSFRVYIFGLVDPLDGNLTAGMEYGLEPRWSLTADLGMVFYSEYLSRNNRALGYIFKPGIRYYLTERRRGFMDAGFFYKRVGYQMNDWLQREVTNGVPAYEEYRTFIYRKRVVGFQFTSGIKARLNKAQTLWLEAYGGFSVRIKWQDVKNIPDAVYARNNLLANGIRETYAVLPGIPIGIRLTYDLPK